jgi:Raf kinase inhibitor-like YbhB/YbcL family protein
VPPFTLFSQDFIAGDVIHVRYTCEGQNQSPSLTWGNVPEGTQSFTLIMDDPDAPRGTFVHWIMYRIPPDVRGLGAGIPKNEEFPDGSRQGINDFDQVGYDGPCPPPRHGPHRYFFRLYALDMMPDLAPAASQLDVMTAIQGHILAQAEAHARFERKMGGPVNA